MHAPVLRSLCVTGFLATCVFWSPTFAQEQNGPVAPAGTPAANSAAPSDATSGTGATGNAVTPPPKRVWTNDDMGNIHRNSSISEFSGNSNKPAKTNGKPPATTYNKDAKRYQDQIANLRAKLPPIDDKISALQATLSGKTVNQTRVVGGNRIDDWSDELARLQKQRADIEEKISAVQDQARHNGVPDNQIPQ